MSLFLTALHARGGFSKRYSAADKRAFYEQWERENSELVPRNNQFAEYAGTSAAKIRAKGRIVKERNSLIFIAVTSGPNNIALRDGARMTWLLPCVASPLCDYRFFTDAVFPSVALLEELSQHGDLVFRSSCSLMDRHPKEVHYGNAPYSYRPKRNASDAAPAYEPDYQYRRAYKIDWKACFAKWALEHGRMASFHAYVEDDSYICMENLLHQTSLLAALHPSGPAFRTGQHLFDGFDDSSTFMSRDIAEAFAKHYPTPDFDCAAVLEKPLVEQQHIANGTANWMSWGNSWRSDLCNWPALLLRHPSIHINVTIPFTSCFYKEGGKKKMRTINGRYVPSREYLRDKSIRFPCREESLIRHHEHIAMVVLTQPYPQHICEHTLFLDKVKDASEMDLLWRLAREKDLLDYSLVFTHTAGLGFDALIHKYNSNGNSTSAV